MADVFAGGQEVKPNQVSFGKIGDFIIGYYTGHKEITTDRGVTKLYELKGILGEYHNVETTSDENGNKQVKVDANATKVEAGDYFNVWGGKDAIDSLFAKSKLGQKVGVRFEEAIPSKKKGNSPFKVFKTVMWDEYDTSNPISDVFPGSEVEGVNI